ncbi:MAG: helix-turn-helix domain-containing protein [Alphaproteobacteria bacterium]
MRQPRLAKRVDEHVGERIRQRRTLLGLTQEQLASALEISYQQVQKYETGANRVSAGRLYEIAKHLDVEIGFFFEGLEPTSKTVPLPHGGRNRATIELVRNFGEIDDPLVRNAVSSLVKSLSDRTNPGHGLSASPEMGPPERADKSAAG